MVPWEAVQGSTPPASRLPRRWYHLGDFTITRPKVPVFVAAKYAFLPCTAPTPIAITKVSPERRHITNLLTTLEFPLILHGSTWISDRGTFFLLYQEAINLLSFLLLLFFRNNLRSDYTSGLSANVSPRNYRNDVSSIIERSNNLLLGVSFLLNFKIFDNFLLEA